MHNKQTHLNHFLGLNRTDGYNLENKDKEKLSCYIQFKIVISTFKNKVKLLFLRRYRTKKSYQKDLNDKLNKIMTIFC